MARDMKLLLLDVRKVTISIFIAKLPKIIDAIFIPIPITSNIMVIVHAHI